MGPAEQKCTSTSIGASDRCSLLQSVVLVRQVGSSTSYKSSSSAHLQIAHQPRKKPLSKEVSAHTAHSVLNIANSSPHSSKRYGRCRNTSNHMKTRKTTVAKRKPFSPTQDKQTLFNHSASISFMLIDAANLDTQDKRARTSTPRSKIGLHAATTHMHASTRFSGTNSLRQPGIPSMGNCLNTFETAARKTPLQVRLLQGQGTPPRYGRCADTPKTSLIRRITAAVYLSKNAGGTSCVRADTLSNAYASMASGGGPQQHADCFPAFSHTV